MNNNWENDREKELIQDLKKLLSCQRAIQNLKIKCAHLTQAIIDAQNSHNKAYYQSHLTALEQKLQQTKTFVSRLKIALASLSADEQAALSELYIKPSGKKKIGSQGQVYRLKSKAIQKLFIEFHGSL